MPNEATRKISMSTSVSKEYKKPKSDYSKLGQTQSKHISNKTDDASSFGLLSFGSSDVDHLGSSIKEQRKLSEISTQLVRERQLAQMTLQKTLGRSAELEKHCKRPVRLESSMTYQRHTDSTISERDFLGESSFMPDQVSTPRVSTDDHSDDGLKNLAQATRRISQAHDELLHKMRTSDISIPDVCKEMKSRMKLPNISVSSDTFTPAELAAEKLLADELSWRREKDIPGRRSEIFYNTADSVFDKISVSEFFRQKSDDISDIIPNRSPSPNKRHSPVPLVDNTCSFTSVSSPGIKKSLSVSGIAKVLAEMNTEDSPNGIISLLCKQGKGRQSPGDKENTCLSTDDLPTQMQKTRRSISKESRHKSLSPIGSFKSDATERSTTLAEKSLTSLRSGSSLSNLPDGKLPIEASKTELSWGCTKLGKTAVQVCTIIYSISQFDYSLSR